MILTFSFFETQQVNRNIRVPAKPRNGGKTKLYTPPSPKKFMSPDKDKKKEIIVNSTIIITPFATVIIFLAFRTTVLSYTQAGIFTTELPTKN